MALRHHPLGGDAGFTSAARDVHVPLPIASATSGGITPGRATTPRDGSHRIWHNRPNGPDEGSASLTFVPDIGDHDDVGNNKPARGTGGHRGEGHGLVIFASVLLLVPACFNLIDGIAAVASSHVFIANAHYVFGDLRAWGWITLILGACCSCWPRPGCWRAISWPAGSRWR